MSTFYFVLRSHVIDFGVVYFFYQDLQHFPHVQVRLKLQRRNADGSKAPTLIIRLEKISKRNTTRAFALRFPKVKIHLLVMVGVT